MVSEAGRYLRLFATADLGERSVVGLIPHGGIMSVKNRVSCDIKWWPGRWS